LVHTKTNTKARKKELHGGETHLWEGRENKLNNMEWTGGKEPSVVWDLLRRRIKPKDATSQREPLHISSELL